jgi:hypothetical protein
MRFLCCVLQAKSLEISACVSDRGARGAVINAEPPPEMRQIRRSPGES